MRNEHPGTLEQKLKEKFLKLLDKKIAAAKLLTKEMKQECLELYPATETFARIERQILETTAQKRAFEDLKREIEEIIPKQKEVKREDENDRN